MTRFTSSPSSRLRAIFLFFPHVALALLPKVDFARMGVVGIAGNFAGLDFASNTSFVFDPSSSTILSRSASDGSLMALGSTNEGGSILAACDLEDKIYIAGLFTSLGSVAASNIAVYDPATSQFAPVGSGLDGQVDALHCDSSSKTLWTGGKFHAPVGQSATSYGGSIALYTPSSNTWSPPPFFGLAGAASEVLSITPSASGSSIYFAGSFITSFASNASQVHFNSSNNPSVPFSSGATPYSSSLVPIPLSGADITPNPSTTETGFTDIHNILCPTGPDGAGSSWLSRDGFSAVIAARAFSVITASGIRLGNTFHNGQSTTAFSLQAIPNNNFITLNYTDPTTNKVLTCTKNCPLLADPSVPYQDFLFVDGEDPLTGFQLTLTEWKGAAPGLHLMQLLSDGAFAYAVASENIGSCYAPKASSVTTTGEWTEIPVDTSIAGTTQDVLIANVAVGTAPSSSPTLTWDAYVSASGIYDVFLLVPGCTEMQDCDQRTTVDITINPGGGANPVIKTVSQTVESDTNALIYSGPIVPSSPDFTVTVMLALSSTPTGTGGGGGMYELVADRIMFQLLSVNASSQPLTVGGGNATSGELGFGFYEYSTATAAGTVNATAANMPNATETSFDGLAFKLYAGLNGSSSSLTSATTVVQALAPFNSSLIYIGGDFAVNNGPANIASFDGTTLGALSGQGLDGPVSSLALDVGSKVLYVGGSFIDTFSGGTGGRFRGVAKYDIVAGQWSALGGGLNGAVTDMIISGGLLTVTGNFTLVLDSPSATTGVQVGGLATWDIAHGVWSNAGGFLISKQMSLVANSSSGVEYVAGNVASSTQYGADGWAMLASDKQGQPIVQSVPATLESTVSTTSSTKTKRRTLNTRPSPWFPVISSLLFPRQATTAPSALPEPPLTPAPAVLAGIFWTNTSSSTQVVVLGGNFSVSSGEGVAIYNPSTKAVVPLKGDQVNGTVRALQVVGNGLYVGGEFGLSGQGNAGFAVYDLVGQAWVAGGNQGLQSTTGTSVVVRTLQQVPSSSNLLIVAGTFTNAGSVACDAICVWDTNAKAWTALGSGLKGEVSSIDFAGSNSDLIVAGSLTLADGTPSNVARYTFSNTTWSAVGSGADIPGPVTALSVNNQNESSIFAAGSASDGSSPFLLYFDGTKWNSLSTTLQGTTAITQMEMVPLQDQHTANGIIESDRMLMISGSLTSSLFGNASSALFDGATFYPYILSTSSTGSPGLVSSLFHSFTSFSFSQHHFLATGVVILISIAISAGIVFFILLAGILWTLFSRDSEVPNSHVDKDDSDDGSLRRPSSLLEHINAATRTTILGLGGAAAAGGQHQAEDTGETQVEPEHDGSGWLRTETPALAKAGGQVGDDDEQEQGRPSHARYSFQGVGNGELTVRTGAEVVILDDRDPDWWYARDVHTGQEGVVPAAYLY